MTKQCPSCGGDCGRTAKSGCRYGVGPKMNLDEARKTAAKNWTRPNEESTVIPGGFKKSALSTLQKTIKREVLEYAGRISLAEAIGVLEVVKHDLIEEHRE